MDSKAPVNHLLIVQVFFNNFSSEIHWFLWYLVILSIPQLSSYSKTSLARHHWYQAKFWRGGKLTGATCYITQDKKTLVPNLSVDLMIVVIDWVIHLFTVIRMA